MLAQLNLFKIGGVAAAIATTLAVANPASAAVLIGNYPQTDDDRSSFISNTFIKAVGFTLPTGDNYILNNIILRLDNYQSATDTPLLRLYADSTKTSTNPNQATLQNVTFTNPTSLDDAIGNFTFTPTSSFTFSADTRYWLSVTNQGTGSFRWYASDPGVTPTGIPGITFDGYKFSSSTGRPYENTNIYTTVQINATAVPEPASLPGYIALMGGLLAARKVIKSKAAKNDDLK